MKEATGELNLSVVVVVAVALLSAFFFSYVWPMLRNNFDKNSKCSAAICESCKTGHNCKTVQCYIKGKKDLKFSCPYKG